MQPNLEISQPSGLMGGDRESWHTLELRILALMVICVCSTLFVGCEAPNDRSNATMTADVDPEVNAPSSIEPIEKIAVATESTGGSKEGKVMSIVVNQCGIPDPAVDAWATQEGFVSPPLVPEIHAGLTKFTDDSSTPVQPELAESYTRSDDGLIYEFILRSDLRFSDGSALTAADVKWSWERALQKSTGRNRADDVLGVIQGADAIRIGGVSELVGVEVVDDRRLKVKLSVERYDFDILIADPVAAVLKRENVAAWRDVWSNDSDPVLSPRVDLSTESLPVGAGPFKLLSYINERESMGCQLARNDHYWGVPPRLDAIVFTNTPFQGATSFEEVRFATKNLLENGQIDYNPFANEEDYEPNVADGSQVGPRFHKVASPIYLVLLVFNASKPPLDDLSFRKALIASADVSRRFVDPSYTPANRILPPLFHDSVDGLSLLPSSSVNVLRGDEADPRLRHEVPVFSDQHYFHSEEVEMILGAWRDELDVNAWQSVVDSKSLYAALERREVAIRVFEQDVRYPDPYAVLGLFHSTFENQ